jgi:hypothetical protein
MPVERVNPKKEYIGKKINLFPCFQVGFNFSLLFSEGFSIQYRLFRIFFQGKRLILASGC